MMSFLELLDEESVGSAAFVGERGLETYSFSVIQAITVAGLLGNATRSMALRHSSSSLGPKVST